MSVFFSNQTLFKGSDRFQTQALSRPSRAAAKANPYIKHGTTLADHPPARVIAGERHKEVTALSEKALGKRRAIVLSDSDDEDRVGFAKKKKLTDHFIVKRGGAKKTDSEDDIGKKRTHSFSYGKLISDDRKVACRNPRPRQDSTCCKEEKTRSFRQC